MVGNNKCNKSKSLHKDNMNRKVNMSTTRIIVSYRNTQIKMPGFVYSHRWLCGRCICSSIWFIIVVVVITLNFDAHIYLMRTRYCNSPGIFVTGASSLHT